ncbi:hypothetical protein Hbl1158_03335 [Halobaculum sp. CBA1158]|uniref:hypothetical protein n=1 Tax=Halobaculum sp. CBA1158 TaxID=2904243 RepID=UPI001F169662|nr:hypothetical protein [Halobaculum sp. CBA1158]UIP00411.1 hypothetical protein Hbl1158_03335 [Halobaculum sp. CBA1158]
MNDSDRFERLAEKHAQNRHARLEGVKRWVEYIQTHPPEEWGPQQNAVVNEQLRSARETGLSAEHEKRVRAFAEENGSD